MKSGSLTDGRRGSSIGTIPSRRLRTLRDAGNYIAKLPRREQDVPAWRTAVKALMLVAEHGGDTMLPRIAIMRALYAGETAPTPGRKRAGKYRIVR